MCCAICRAREIAEFALMLASTALFPRRVSERRLDATVDERCDFIALHGVLAPNGRLLSFAFLWKEEVRRSRTSK
jgi:hypothetical protein